MKYEICKNKFLRKTLASWCAFATLATMCGPAWAATTVLSDNGAGGAIANNQSSGITYGSDTMNNTINGSGGYIKWDTFNVGNGQSPTFGSGDWFNSVHQGSESRILGAIKGSGANVYVFNDCGFVFGQNCVIDVGNFTAAAMAMNNIDALIAGTETTPVFGDPSGEVVVNGGTFKAAKIAFAGTDVEIKGGTFNGATTLAAGDKITIDSVAGGTISMTIPSDASSGDIEFDGVSTFADALVAKAGGEVIVGNGSEVTVNGANGLDIAAEAFHVDNSKVDVTAGKLTAQVSDRIAVMGTSSVHAKGDLALTVTDGNVAIADGFAASVKSDANVAITANGGDITMDKGGEIVGQNVTLSATGTGSHKDISMAAGSTITAKGALAVTTANGSVTEDAGAKILATGNASFTAANGDITLAGTANDFSKGGVDKVVNATAKNVTINEGGDTSIAGNTGISLGTVKATAGDVKVTDTTGTITAKGATVEATEGNVIVSASKDIAVGDADTANNTYVKAGQNIRMESQNGAIDIVSRVTAGKNLTIVSEKATTGSKVKIDAQYLNDKKILTAEDGSIYVAAEANDIEINNGTIITATDKTKTDSSAAGNILLKSESGSVTPAEGTATIVADNGKGVAALVGGGTVGNKNLTIKAGVTVLNSTGKGADTPDVKAVFEGDTKLVANAVHDVDIEIVGGTLTIDSQANALAGKNVNEVLYSPSATPSVSIQQHALKAYANDSRGVEAGNDIKIQGYNANLVVANNSSVLAGTDITVNMDGNETVLGAMQAGKNIAQNIGGNITVSGTESAGNDIAETMGGNSTVSGTVQAGRDVTETIGGNSDVSGEVVAGHDVNSKVGRNTTISGTVQAGRDVSLTTGSNLATPGVGKIVAGQDLIVKVGTSTPQINVAVGKGISAVSGERAIAFKTVGGYAYPEVYGNDSETAVFIDGRVAGGNSADFSILQGYEQAAVAGNFFLMPAFTQTGNIFPLLNYTDMQAPGAAFAQGYLSSDKGEMTEMDEGEAEADEKTGETADSEEAPAEKGKVAAK